MNEFDHVLQQMQPTLSERSERNSNRVMQRLQEVQANINKPVSALPNLDVSQNTLPPDDFNAGVAAALSRMKPRPTAQSIMDKHSNDQAARDAGNVSGLLKNTMFIQQDAKYIDPESPAAIVDKLDREEYDATHNTDGSLKYRAKDMASDLGLSVVSGGLKFGDSMLSLADLSGKGYQEIGKVLGINGTVNDTAITDTLRKGGIDLQAAASYVSNKLSAAGKERVQGMGVAATDYSDTERYIADMQANGTDPEVIKYVAGMSRFIEQGGNIATYLKDNPSAAIPTVGDAIGQLLGMVVGSKGLDKLSALGSKVPLASGAKAQAASNAINKATGLAGMEGATILGAAYGQAADAARQGGYSLTGDDIATLMANAALQRTISGVTGGSLDDRLTGGVLQSTGNAAKQIARETGQEALQEPIDQFAQNIIGANHGQGNGLTDDLAQASIMGALGGFGASASINAAGATPKAVDTLATKAASALDARAAKQQDTARKAPLDPNDFVGRYQQSMELIGSGTLNEAQLKEQQQNVDAIDEGMNNTLSMLDDKVMNATDDESRKAAAMQREAFMQKYYTPYMQAKEMMERSVADDTESVDPTHPLSVLTKARNTANQYVFQNQQAAKQAEASAAPSNMPTINTQGLDNSALPTYKDNKTTTPVANSKAVGTAAYLTQLAGKDVGNNQAKDPNESLNWCAKYVRMALEKAGYKFQRQASAYQYHTNGTLKKAGFNEIDINSDKQVGDVIVFEPVKGHKHGHIAMWNGQNWVSDFVQKNKDGLVSAAYAPSLKNGRAHLYRDAKFVGGTTTRQAPSNGFAGALHRIEGASNKFSDPYNVTTHKVGSKYKNNLDQGKKITDMTVYAFVNKQGKGANNIFVGGAYQFKGSTVQMVMKEAGVSAGDKFDKNTQDKLFAALASRGKVVQNYLQGKGDETKALNYLATQWSSLPYNGTAKSYYAADKAHISWNEALELVRGVKSTYDQLVQSGMDSKQAMQEAFLAGVGGDAAPAAGGSTDTSGQSSRSGADVSPSVDEMLEEIEGSEDDGETPTYDEPTAADDSTGLTVDNQADDATVAKQTTKELFNIVNFSKYTEADIDNLVGISEEQRRDFKTILRIKQKIKADTANGVNKQIMEGKAGNTALSTNIGLKQYDEVLTQALKSGNETRLAQYMGYLERFAATHDSKANAIREVLATSPNESVKLVNTEQGWRRVDANETLPENANTYTVTPNNPLNKQIQDEARTIRATYDGYKKWADTVMGTQAPVQATETAAAPTAPTEAPQATSEPVASDEATNIDSKQGKYMTGFASHHKQNKTGSGWLLADPKTVDIKRQNNQAPIYGNVEAYVMNTYEENGKNDATPSKNRGFKENVTETAGFAQSVAELKRNSPNGLSVSDEQAHPEIGFLNEFFEALPDKPTAQDVKSLANNIAGYDNGIVWANAETDMAQPEFADTAPSDEADMMQPVFDAPPAEEDMMQPVFDDEQDMMQPTFDSELDMMQPVFADDTQDMMQPDFDGWDGNEAEADSNAADDFMASVLADTATMEAELSGRDSNAQAALDTANEEEMTPVDNSQTEEAPSKQRSSYTSKPAGKTDKGDADAGMNVRGNKYTSTRNDVLADGSRKQVIDNEKTWYDTAQVQDIAGDLLGSNLSLATAMPMLKDLVTDNVSKRARSAQLNLLDLMGTFAPKTKIRVTTGGDVKNRGDAILVDLSQEKSPYLQILEVLVPEQVFAAMHAVDDYVHEDKGSINYAAGLMTQASKAVEEVQADLAEYLDNNTDWLQEQDSEFKEALMYIAYDANNAAEVVSVALTNDKVSELLSDIKTKEQGTHKTSLFKKIINAIAGLFKVDSKAGVSTLFEKLVSSTTLMQVAADYTVPSITENTNDGLLTAFANAKAAKLSDKDIVAKEAAKPYTQRNLLLFGFRQQQDSSKPLSAISNILSKLKGATNKVSIELTGTLPNTVQQTQLDDFYSFTEELKEYLINSADNRVGTNKKGEVRDYRYNDLGKYLINDDGSIDENVITALSLSAYSMLIEDGSYGAKTFDGVLSMLKAHEQADLPADMYERYKHFSTFNTVMADKLGERAMSYLNIKQNDNLAPLRDAEMANSLGNWIIAAMQQADLVHIHTVPVKQYVEDLRDLGSELMGNEASEAGNISFVGFTNLQGNGYNNRIAEVIDASRGTKSYLSKLFGDTVGLRAPSITPIEKVNTKIRGGSGAKPSKEQQGYIKTMQDSPMLLDESTYSIIKAWSKADNASLLNIMGADSTDDALKYEHISNVENARAKAQNHERELNNMLDWGDSLPSLDTPFYDSIFSSVNSRMGYDSNMFNMQSSKIHRGVGSYAAWKHTLDTQETTLFNDEGMLTDTGMFFVALAERAEGTEDALESSLKDKYSRGYTVDKVAPSDFLPVFTDYILNDPVTTAATAAVRESLNNNNKLTQDNIKAISAGVKAWGMGSESLRGLVELAKYQEAQDNGTAFETHIGIGSDGVNNGTAISMLLFGVVTPDTLAQVGMITKGYNQRYGINNYHDSRTVSSIDDYYEGLIKIMEPILDAAIAQNPLMRGINSIHPNLATRKTMKQFLIPFGYGSGLNSMVRSGMSYMLDDYYKQLGKLAKLDEAGDKQAADALHTKLNNALKNDLGLKGFNLPREGYLDHAFTKSELRELGEIYTTEMTGLLNTSIKAYAAPFVVARNNNLALHNAAYSMFARAYDDINAQIMEDYRAAYKNMSDTDFTQMVITEGIPKRFVSKEMRQALKAISPKLDTIFSQNVEDSAESKLRIYQYTKTNTDNVSVQTKNYYVNSAGKISPQNFSGKRKEFTPEDTGLRSNSVQVQSLDAYVASRTSDMNGEGGILNVHDSMSAGIAKYPDMVRLQNKATFEGILNYNNNQASIDAMLSVLESAELTNMDTLLEYVPTVVINGRLIDNSDLHKMVNHFLEKEGKDEVKYLSREAKLYIATKYAYVRELAKLDALSDLHSMHQYAGYDGAYMLTEADYAAIEAKRAEVLSNYEKHRERIKAVLKGDAKKEDPMTDYEDTEAYDTTMFDGANEHQLALRDMVEQVFTESGKEMPTIEFVSINDMASNVNMMRQAAGLDALSTGELTNVQGYYDNANNVIQLNNHVVASMTPEQRAELVLHEYLHAITNENINNALLSDKPSPASDAVTVLEAMGKELINQRLLTDKEAAVLLDETGELDVRELVAYGLTRPSFMEAISKLPTGRGTAVGSANSVVKGNRIAAPLQRFYKAILSLFGLGKSNRSYDRFVRLTQLLMEQKSTEAVDNTIDRGQSYELNFSRHTGAMSDAEVLQTLDGGNRTSEHNEHLNALITGLFEGYRAGGYTADPSSTMPSKAIKAGFSLSDKEAATHDALKAAIRYYMDTHNDSAVAQRLKGVFDAVSKQLKVEDFMANPAGKDKADKAQARKKYNYLMKQDSANRKEQLERFVSLALVSNELQDVVNKYTNATKGSEQSWFGKLMAFYHDLVDQLTNGRYSLTNKNSTEQMTTLVKQLANIQNSSRHKVGRAIEAGYTKAFNKAAKPMDTVTKKTYNYLFGQTDIAMRVVNSLPARFKQKRLFVLMAAVLSKRQEAKQAGVDVPTLGNQVTDVLGRTTGSNSYNTALELLNEISGNSTAKKVAETFVRITNRIGQARQNTKDVTISTLRNLFTDASAISEADSTTLLRRYIKTDVSSLLDNGYTISQIISMMKSPKKQQARINELIETLEGNHADANDLIIQAKSLAYYLATDDAPKHVVFNAESIAARLGTKEIPSIKDQMNGKDVLAATDKRLVKQLDELVTLLALQQTNDQAKSIEGLLDTELEALKGIIRIHKEMTDKAKEDFSDEMANYRKGYTPELGNQYRSIMPVFLDQVAEYEKQGWVLLADELSQDSADNSEPKALMYHRDMQFRTRVTGALDLADDQRKGTTVYSQNATPTELMKSYDKLRKERNHRSATMSHKNYDPSKYVGNFIAGYSSVYGINTLKYEVSGFMRDKYLERNQDLFEVMGTYASRMAFKPQIREVQEQLAEVHYQDYRKHYGKSPRDFVLISADSPDKRVAEVYRMLPDSYRRAAKELYGENVFAVRKSVFNATFGYRSYSLADMFDKVGAKAASDDDHSTQDVRNPVEELFVTMLDTTTGGKGKAKVLTAERIWQKGVGTMKDFIVIRNAKVLLGNLLANTLLLGVHGINPVQMSRDFTTIWREGREYRRMVGELKSLNLQMIAAGGRGTKHTELKRRAGILAKRIKESSVHEYMEAGLMSTIVEDVTVSEHRKEYTSDLERKLTEQYERVVPKAARTGLNWLMMNPGTPMHQFMSDVTQFSDFAAKYSLAKHLQSQGMSFEDSISEAQESFINYDVPTNRGMDYMNKIGAFMFTKFLLNFQRALNKLLGSEKAGRVIAQHYGVEGLTDSAGILDPLWLNRLGSNPFHVGALGLPDAAKDITTVQMLSTLW